MDAIAKLPRTLLVISLFFTSIMTAHSKNLDYPYIEITQVDSSGSRLLKSSTGKTNKKLIDCFWNEARALSKHNEINYSGPSASHIEIKIHKNQKEIIILRSWHTIAEKNSKLLATARALVSVSNEKERKKILSAQPKEYLQFRKLFEEILTKL